MISHSELSQILERNVIEDLGFSDEYFFSLPFSCQKELIMSYFDSIAIKKRKDNQKNILALKQYNGDGKIKQKVLTFLKRNK